MICFLFFLSFLSVYFVYCLLCGIFLFLPLAIASLNRCFCCCILGSFCSDLSFNVCFFYWSLQLKVGVSVAHPGITNDFNDEDAKKYYTYYQWVCFVLFFQVRSVLIQTLLLFYFCFISHSCPSKI